MRILYILWSYLTTYIFAFVFFLSLCIWEIFMRIAHLFGYRVSQAVMHSLMRVILYELLIVGTRVRFLPARCELAHERPLILVSNHQSLLDIPFAFWYFRKFHVKFVSKKELAQNVPTVSFHLRNGFHALIDRKDREQAVRAITALAQKAEKERFAALIYPEGSRSKDGVLREFKVRGLATLLENMPSALVVPIAVDGSWRLAPRSFSYIPFGSKCKFVVLGGIEPAGKTAEEVLAQCEALIRQEIGQYCG
jgi:1-acyl-sn-glycerol-3-phosphate acyltransferase